MLLMGGNHGDEYEGQVLVSSLIREIEPQWVRGQLIFLPMANFPAAAAGLRTSPLDGGNLNRSFPGDAQGTPTAAIADYIEHTLLVRADYLIDLHSGGSSLLYDGANMLAIEPRDPEEEARLKSLLTAFGLPRAFLHRRTRFIRRLPRVVRGLCRLSRNSAAAVRCRQACYATRDKGY